MPWSLSFFVGNRSQYRRLPRTNERISPSDCCLNDFLFFDFQFTKFDEVNLVLRGSSLDHRKINKQLPTFFVNVQDVSLVGAYANYYLLTGDLRVLARHLGWHGFDHYAEGGGRHKVCYVAGMDDLVEINTHSSKFTQSDIVKKIKSRLEQNRMDVLFTNFQVMGGIKNRFGIRNFQIGSGLAALVALLNLSNKVNVYGWDQYLDNDPPPDYAGQVKCLCQKKNLVMSNIITSLINWIYAFRVLKELPQRVTIDGYIVNVKEFCWIPVFGYPVIYKKSLENPPWDQQHLG